MASDYGPVTSTAGAPVHAVPSISTNALPTTPSSIASPSILPSALSASDTENQSIRKLTGPNIHEQSPKLPNLTSIASAGLRASPLPKSPKDIAAMSPRFSPVPTPLTGAAAMADERRQRQEKEQEEARKKSDNPAVAALGILLGSNSQMSRPRDAPTATNTMSKGMEAVANSISVPEPMQVDENSQSSPVSMTSLGNLESTAPTATTTNPTTAGANIPGTQTKDHAEFGRIEAGSARPEDRIGRSQTFPTSMDYGEEIPGFNRADTMPNPSWNPSSPSAAKGSGKHKCQYCHQAFTRHHNLKSHLLTHSQEKPFVCQTCQARFRRLHDLKRHTKLHTGERPHICPKCGRRFARGDALARHSKGQGGCAGRRTSIGGFGDEDYGDGSRAGEEGMHGDNDDGMDGLLFTGDDTGDIDEDDDLAEERRRQMSLPSIKTHDTSQPGQSSTQGEFQHQHHPSTYPPARGRGIGGTSGGLLPPNMQGSSPSTTSPRVQTSTVTPNTTMTNASSATISAGGSSMFSQGGMTESPKPLSPAGMLSHQLGHSEGAGGSGSSNRLRSPSITTQMQQQQFGRKPGGRSTPPVLPVPGSTSSQNIYHHHQHHGGPSGPPAHLPAIHGLPPPDPRFTLASQAGASQPSSQLQESLAQARHPGGQPANSFGQSGSGASISTSAGGSASTHGQGSGDGSNMFSSGTDGLWAYVRSLEERINVMAEEIKVLKSQVGAQTRQTDSPAVT